MLKTEERVNVRCKCLIRAMCNWNVKFFLLVSEGDLAKANLSEKH